MENADKNTTRITYDERGNIRNIRDAGGTEISYQYDLLNRVVRTTDGNGNNTLFEYDEADRIRKVTNPLGDSRSYRYNESGRVTQMTDYDGFSVRLEYNCLNKPQTITDKEGNITRFYYDKMWNISELQQADGGKYHYKYDILGRLEEECFPEGGTVSYTYDKNGNRTGETDGEGNKTSFEYDALNRVIKITDAAGAETCYDYDQDGNIVCITDAFKNCTYYTYDDVGRRTGETDALGNKTIYTYTPAGKPEKIIYANGTTERYLYRDGLLEKVYRADGSSQQYQYDKNRNILSVISGTGEEVCYTYDALNRVVSQKTGDGKSTFEYDSTGNLKKYTDENGNVTKYEYSPNGNLKKVTDALGNETGYGYDCMGNLIKVEQTGIGPGTGGYQITSYERDLEGRVIKATDPAGYVERYSCDKNGRMIKKEDRDNFCTTFRHGNTGDLTEIAYGDGRSVRFSYDALHRLEEVKDWNGTTKIMADALGRIRSVTEPDGNRISYKWGPAGEKSALFYPDGKKAEYSYNGRGLLERLTTGKGTIKYKYDEDGRLIKKELPNGAITSYTYNSGGRLGQIRHEAEGFSESYRYDYDAAGNKIRAEKNRSGIDADRGNFGYEYDALNRLVRVTENGKLLREYGYDAFGNRTLKKEYTDGQEKIVQYRYNEKNQLLSENGNGIEKIYRYDKRGNMTEVCVGEKKIKQFTFDAANRMSAAVGMDGCLVRRAEYRYNGLGQRIGQNIRRTETEGINIRYTIDPTRAYYNMLCLETEDKKQDFYWDDNVVAMEEGEAESYYIQDDLGSPLRLLDELGGSREIYGYDEFGVNLCQEPEKSLCYSVQPFGYTGYQMEEAGGLYFAQARRYDAGLGRFISEDLMRGFIEMPYTLNHYGYCWNRPLDLVDLDGWIPTVPTWAKAVGVIAVGISLVVGAALLIPVITAGVVSAGVAAGVTAAGVAIGGVIGGINNTETCSGSFTNGAVGGMVNGAISVGGALVVSPYISNAVGGAMGSTITDVLNNLDKPKDEWKSLREIRYSAFMAGGTQSLISGSLAKIWESGTAASASGVISEGWNITNTNGVNRALTVLWDVFFAGGFSHVVGATASITSGETWSTFDNLTGFLGDNSVKE